MRFYLMVQLEFLLMTSYDCLSDISRARSTREVAFFAISAIRSLRDHCKNIQNVSFRDDNYVSARDNRRLRCNWTIVECFTIKGRAVVWRREGEELKTGSRRCLGDYKVIHLQGFHFGEPTVWNKKKNVL